MKVRSTPQQRGRICNLRHFAGSFPGVTSSRLWATSQPIPPSPSRIQPEMFQPTGLRPSDSSIVGDYSTIGPWFCLVSAWRACSAAGVRA